MPNTGHLSVPGAGRTHTIADGSYGSDDATGLVWAYEFTRGQPGRPVESARIPDLLSEVAAESFLWLHFSLLNSRSESWMRQHVALPDSFYELITARASTRVESVDESLVAVIRDMPFFGGDARSVGTMAICVNTRLMISARTQQLRSVDRLRAAVRRGDIFESPAELLAHLLRDQADVLMEVVREATGHVDEVEDKLLDSFSLAGRSALGLVRRRLVRVQRVLAPEPAALFRLLSRPPSWLPSHDVAELRRSVEELSTAVTDSAVIVERSRILQDELSARLAESTSRMLFILTVLTAVVAPIGFISGLFGMNLAGIPFHDSPHGFWIVFVLIFVIIGLGSVLVGVFLKRL